MRRALPYRQVGHLTLLHAVNGLAWLETVPTHHAEQRVVRIFMVQTIFFFLGTAVSFRTLALVQIELCILLKTYDFPHDMALRQAPKNLNHFNLIFFLDLFFSLDFFYFLGLYHHFFLFFLLELEFFVIWYFFLILLWFWLGSCWRSSHSLMSIYYHFFLWSLIFVVLRMLAWRLKTQSWLHLYIIVRTRIYLIVNFFLIFFFFQGLMDLSSLTSCSP